jgi:hypothetical protein
MQEQGTQTSTPLLTEIDVVGGAEQLLRADAEEFAHKQPPSCERLSIRSVLRIEGANRLCTYS